MAVTDRTKWMERNRDAALRPEELTTRMEQTRNTTKIHSALPEIPETCQCVRVCSRHYASTLLQAH